MQVYNQLKNMEVESLNFEISRLSVSDGKIISSEQGTDKRQLRKAGKQYAQTGHHNKFKSTSVNPEEQAILGTFLGRQARQSNQQRQIVVEFRVEFKAENPGFRNFN